MTITCRHYFTLPWDARATGGNVWPEGGGILLRISKNEYIIAGSGIVIEFAKNTEKATAGTHKVLGEDGFVRKEMKTIKPEVAGRHGMASVAVSDL